MAKNKDSWFFTKNIIDEINSVPDELLSLDQEETADFPILGDNRIVQELVHERLLAEKHLDDQETTTTEMPDLEEGGAVDKSSQTLEAKEASVVMGEANDETESVPQEDLKSEIQAFEQQLADLQAALEKTEEEKQMAIEEQHLLERQHQELQKEMMLQVVKIDELQGHVDLMEQQASESHGENKRLEQTVKNQQAELFEGGNQLEEMRMKIETMQDELQRVLEEKNALSNELLHTMGENQNLRAQLKEREHQSEQLMETSQLLQAATNENQKLQKEISQLAEPLEQIAQLNAEKNALTIQLVKATEEAAVYQAQYEEKERVFNEQFAQLEQSNAELAALQSRIESGEFLQGSEYDLYVEAQEKINQLVEQNEQLTKEIEYSQKEIGEVLLTAKKQASRTLEEAQAEADHLIKAAKLELEGMENKARKILIEIDESKETVSSMYSDLQEKVRQLASGNLQVDFEKRVTRAEQMESE
ncbi:hypothetical protein D922_04185 [Enterococcus faecalis 06-MB-DW-09]|nr:hypothetical protein D922_04185 [Enterococcus faecalis 06-MB-DW-09]